MKKGIVLKKIQKFFCFKKFFQKKCLQSHYSYVILGFAVA